MKLRMYTRLALAMKVSFYLLFAVIIFNGCFSVAHAALTVDRSRLILNEGQKSVSLNVTNQNKQDPYLAQGWIEDGNEKKLAGPLMVLPPVQRIEPASKTMVRIQALPDTAQLPKDRESVFYFNLREIPPKSEKPNVLMLAMQTRLKVFYRPKGIIVDEMADVVPGVETLELNKEGDNYIVSNPTPYHFTFVEVRQSLAAKPLAQFDPIMVAPKGRASLAVSAAQLGNTPVLMFINDYGSQRLLPFSCSGTVCKAGKVQMPPAPAQPKTVAPFPAQSATGTDARGEK